MNLKWEAFLEFIGAGRRVPIQRRSSRWEGCVSALYTSPLVALNSITHVHISLWNLVASTPVRGCQFPARNRRFQIGIGSKLLPCHRRSQTHTQGKIVQRKEWQRGKEMEVEKVEVNLHITDPAAVDRWRTSSDFDEDRGERGDLRNGGTDATDAVLTCSERGYLHTGYLCVMLDARSTRWTYISTNFSSDEMDTVH